MQTLVGIDEGYASFTVLYAPVGINNSSTHLNPRCNNKAGLETFLKKLQRNIRHDQETVLAE